MITSNAILVVAASRPSTLSELGVKKSEEFYKSMLA
jgi:hypothetical protein